MNTPLPPCQALLEVQGDSGEQQFLPPQTRRETQTFREETKAAGLRVVGILQLSWSPGVTSTDTVAGEDFSEEVTWVT